MIHKILVADDDAAVRKALANVLESEGFDVLVAENAREAVREFIAEPPSLVLLDINMPDKSGWEVFKMMEALHPFVPVIVITARPNQYERALLDGVDALMEKPLDFVLLLKTIERLVREGEKDRIDRLCRKEFSTEFLSRATATPSPLPGQSPAPGKIK